jgi:hypothetical protein
VNTPPVKGTCCNGRWRSFDTVQDLCAVIIVPVTNLVSCVQPVGQEVGLILPTLPVHRENLPSMTHESPDLGCGYTASATTRITPVRYVIKQMPARHRRSLAKDSLSGPGSVPHRTEVKNERDSCIGKCAARGPNSWQGFVRLAITPRW